VICLG